jgi:serine protease
MPDGTVGAVRCRLLLAAAGLGALAAAAVAPSGVIAARDLAPVPTAAPIRALPTLAHRTDCFPPLLVSVACGGAGTPLRSHGGPIQPAAAVYIVFWGWHGSDPSGQAAYQEAFFNGVGGTTWNASQTQYCAPASGLLNSTCATGSTHVGNPAGVLKGTWSDDTNPVPSHPTDAAIQAEAVRAAAFFGKTSPASNTSTQYVIDTPQGNSTSGFNTQWCAYHGSASSSYGALSYTDFPYMTDAGANCGQNAVNTGAAGALDGVSIVGGHEFAEAETDPDANSGWFDTAGNETGDKCAWIIAGPGAMTDISLSTGSFAVQGLWSNNADSGAGSCVTFYAGSTNQH